MTRIGSTYDDFTLLTSFKFSGEANQMFTGKNGILVDSNDDVFLAFSPNDGDGPLQVVKV